MISLVMSFAQIVCVVQTGEPDNYQTINHERHVSRNS